LQTIISQEGYEHYKLEDLKDHPRRGCSMCLKILDALEEKVIEDEPETPG
jgi:hypothetical protein